MGPFAEMTQPTAHRTAGSVRLLAFASVSLALACSSSDPGPAAQGGAPNNSAGAPSHAGAGGGGAPSGGAAATQAGGAAATQAGAGGGGATGGAGTAGTVGSAGSASGGSTSAGAAGMATGGATAGGGAAAGQGGLTGGGGTGGGSSVQGFTCNLLIGIDSTGEWFTSGFENQVPNDRWEIIYHHPAYIEDWAKAGDDVYKLAPTSPCATNADNPDRVIFNMFADTADASIGNKGAWVTALTQAVTNLKAKYSRLKRIDLLTMTRAPNNAACDSTNASGSSVAQYVDDAVMMMITNGPPAVTASPKFFAKDCNVFTSGGPHLTDAGKPVIAKLYGDYYSAEN